MADKDKDKGREDTTGYGSGFQLGAKVSPRPASESFIKRMTNLGASTKLVKAMSRDAAAAVDSDG